MAHLITRFISRSTYVVVLKNSVGTLLYSLSLFSLYDTGASKDPGTVKFRVALARYLWGFCANETSRETNCETRLLARLKSRMVSEKSLCDNTFKTNIKTLNCLIVLS